MDVNQLYLDNPTLFWSGVGTGNIPYSEAPGNLTWGANVQSLLIESFLGGPHAPDYRPISQPGTNFAVPTQLAESGAYPKPWRSAAQKTQQSSYTNVGPYAALIGIEGKQLCCREDDPAKIARVYGRWGYATSGPAQNQGAFFPQDWYNQDEGTFDAEYWNDYFEVNQPPGLVPEWQLRPDWWGSSEKSTIRAYIANTGIECQIEVLYEQFDIDDPEYFPGLDLAAYPDFSFDVLVVMISVAAITRWG